MYRVTIPYREPTYEMHRGRPRKNPYLAQYEVSAETKEAAIESALELFEKDARDSRVGWVRFPIHEDITVEPL